MLERRVSPQLEEIMEARRSYIFKQGDVKRVNPLEGIDRAAGVIMPIISAGDIMGAVIMLEPESSNTVPSESDIKLAQVAAAFLGKQMEE